MNDSEQPLKRPRIVQATGYPYCMQGKSKYPPRMWATTIYCNNLEDWHREVMNLMGDGATPWNERINVDMSYEMINDLASKCLVRVAYLPHNESELRSMFLLVKGG